MAQAQPFVWGGGGQQLTYEQTKKRREVADALAAKGETPQTFGAGLNRIGEALLAKSYGDQASASETAGAESRKAVIDALLGNADPTMADLGGALSNDWVANDAGSSAVVQALLGQEMQQNDPLRQQQLQMGQIELDNARNPPAPSPDYGFIELPDGSIVRTDATSGGVEDMGQFGSPDSGMTDTQVNLSWRAEQAGLTPGTPEYAEFMRSGGQSTGMALSVGPDGTVQFSQGGAGGKPLTEGQSKDAVFVTRANNALPTIDKYEQALLSLGENVAGNIPYGNFLQSEEYQVARDAGREFLATVLRKDTGAAVTPSEEAMYGDMLLPRPGDKPATIEMKRRRRAVAVAAIEAGMPPQAILNSVQALENAGVMDAAGNVMPDAVQPAPNQSSPADIDDILKGYGL